MWIVRIALRRPYTFVAALLLLLATPFVLRGTPVDVFPEVDIPVVAILQSYSGLTAQEMKDRITTPIKRNLANSVSDMEHVESQTQPGLAVIKVFFQPGVDGSSGIAQLVSATQSSMRSLPPGTTPPTIVRYSASSLPAHPAARPVQPHADGPGAERRGVQRSAAQPRHDPGLGGDVPVRRQEPPGVGRP